jgi:hypothetical protein
VPPINTNPEGSLLEAADVVEAFTFDELFSADAELLTEVLLLTDALDELVAELTEAPLLTAALLAGVRFFEEPPPQANRLKAMNIIKLLRKNVPLKKVRIV